MARRRSGSDRNCAVTGCPEEAVRSLSYKKVQKALDAPLQEARRARLCKEHYKEYKKATKVDRTLDRITW